MFALLCLSYKYMLQMYTTPTDIRYALDTHTKLTCATIVGCLFALY